MGDPVVLIIAPHPDDEVYGCTTFLVPGTAVLYCTSDHPDFPQHVLAEEMSAVASKTRIAKEVHRLPTNGLSDQVPATVLIGLFESTIAALRPDVLLLPAPSYNQDHRAVTEAALTAARPHDRNHFVPRVLLFEQPETFGTLRKPDPFRPTYFRRLDIERKRELYEAYATQVRGHRSFEHVRAIAAVRGMQANMDYAEAFEVLRWVE